MNLNRHQIDAIISGLCCLAVMAFIIILALLAEDITR
jgi:hypothetical protein